MCNQRFIPSKIVMAGPSPAIYATRHPQKKAWITGTSPVMTTMSGADAVIYTEFSEPESRGLRPAMTNTGHPNSSDTAHIGAAAAVSPIAGALSSSDRRFSRSR